MRKDRRENKLKISNDRHTRSERRIKIDRRSGVERRSLSGFRMIAGLDRRKSLPLKNPQKNDLDYLAQD